MKAKLLSTSFLLSLIFGCLVVFGQNQMSPQIIAADELLKAQKWAEAATAYEALLKNDPKNGNAWYQLGMARYSLKQYAPSAEAFEKNVALADNAFAMFNLACVYSLMNEKEKAIEWLTKTVNNPKAILQAVNLNDADLANVKEDARVKALGEEIDRKIHPCKFSEQAKQFDFWVGAWDVFNPQGRKDGTSVIERFAGGCGILENWTDSFGGGGKSINFYDSQANKWFQYWIGQDGAPLRYSGIYKDGAIRYEAEPFMQNGKNVLSRLTFFNVDANTVRQLAEQSVDDGKTWTTGYDYKYIRRK